MLRLNDLRRHHAPLQPVIARAVANVLESGWYVLGQFVQRFERVFADFCGVDDAVGVASGTDALELALRALGVGPGDEVVTVANAGMYGTTAILCVGATPVFVDVDSVDMTLDPKALERAIGARCKAVVLTHLYGRLADVDGVLQVAGARGVAVVEDCAHAHGAALGPRRAGSFGKLGCFSFYPTKNLGACGDGGLVVTSDPDLAVRLRQLRQYGWSEKYNAVVAGGRNSRLDELQAAILLEKLPYLTGWTARRVSIAERYTREIANPLVTTPRIEPGRDVAHMYVVQCASRDALREHLRRSGFAAEVHYPVPDHRQPAFADVFRGVRLPVSERLAAEVLTLPCFPEMTDDEVASVIAACSEWRP